MSRSKYFTLPLLLILCGCYSHKKAIENSLPYSQKINWPENYDPESARFFVHNETDIQASPEVVWSILTNAEAWPEWYHGAKNVVITGDSARRLHPGAVFTWSTMGLDFTSTIKEFDAPYRLCWESRKKSIKGYHAWLIIPTEEGCKLVTDESQYGLLTLMQKSFIPNKLRKLHDTWLMEIKSKAESK